MSGLFNLRVGGAEVEDIVCNGQAVEEVWVDGVQVFDAYDPEAVPAGTMSFAGFNGSWPTSYNQATTPYRLTSANGQAGATGYISLQTGAAVEYHYYENDDTSVGSPWTTDSYYDFTGQEINWSHSVNTSISLCYSNGTRLFTIQSRDKVGPISSGDELYAGGKTIVAQSANIHDRKSARIDWNFKTRKFTVSGSNGFVTVTEDFTNKWRPGMYVVLERSTSYSGGSGWYVYHSGELRKSYNSYTASTLSASAGN